MSVTVSTDLSYGYNVAKKLGCSQELLAKAIDSGISFPVWSNIIHVSYDGSVFGSIPIKPQLITLLNDNTLGPASKAALKAAIESGISSAFTKVAHDQSTAGVVKAAPWKSGIASASELAKSAFNPSPSTPEMVPATSWKFGDPHEEQVLSLLKGDESEATALPTEHTMKVIPRSVYSTKHASKVQLEEASSVFQEVAGTSPESVYLCFIVGVGVNIAFRYSDETLSLRAEGKSLGVFALALKEFGMSVKPGYASVHLQVKDRAMVRKIVGALAATLGWENIIETACLVDMMGEPLWAGLS